MKQVVRTFGGAVATIVMCIANIGGISNGQVVSENIPHQPNFLGKNICLGIEAPADKYQWRSPQIRSVTKLDTDQSEHDIIFDEKNRILVTENLVAKANCDGLPTDIARWGKSEKMEFCLKPWSGNRFIKVSISEQHSDPGNEFYIKRSIYAVGACKIGDGGSFYQYGEILKVETIHVHAE